MTKTAFAAFCFVQSMGEFPLGAFVAGNDHLRNAVSVVHDKVLGREIHENDANLAAIV